MKTVLFSSMTHLVNWIIRTNI